MPKNDGKASERYFLDNVQGFVIRLKDKRDLMGLNGGKNVAAFGNPSDFLLCDDDGLCFAEVKSSSSKTSFSLSGFTPTQKSVIARLHKLGHGKLYRIYIHSLETNTWYLIDASKYYETIMTGKKSIPWKNLVNNTLTL